MIHQGEKEMRYIRFINDGKVRHGIIEDSRYRLFREGYDSELTTETVSIFDCRLLPPVEPRKILCIGLNYCEHAEELVMQLPEKPVVFMKPTSSIIGYGDTIVRPEMSNRVDYEGELAIVIGKDCRNVSKEDAKDYIMGYTIANDVTARDLQDKKGQWTICKGFDTFCPLGPYISDEVDPSDLKIQTRLNGEIKQDSSTKYLIFDVPYLVSYLSSCMTLEKGDIILTGTPVGISGMNHGDEVTVSIEGLGELKNYVE